MGITWSRKLRRFQVARHGQFVHSLFGAGVPSPSFTLSLFIVYTDFPQLCFSLRLFIPPGTEFASKCPRGFPASVLRLGSVYVYLRVATMNGILNTTVSNCLFVDIGRHYAEQQDAFGCGTMMTNHVAALARFLSVSHKFFLFVRPDLIS